MIHLISFGYNSPPLAAGIILFRYGFQYVVYLLVRDLETHDVLRDEPMAVLVYEGSAPTQLTILGISCRFVEPSGLAVLGDSYPAIFAVGMVRPTSTGCETFVCVLTKLFE